ncbi:hypothetical protein O9993_07510 [Vibrio lentus]|nr:hypothetical protein [Vibrio lentus]
MEDNGYGTRSFRKALKLISQVGFDPVYGARPLKRAIQQTAENPLGEINNYGKNKSREESATTSE